MATGASCATRTTKPSGLTTSAAQPGAPGTPSSFNSCQTGLPFRPNKDLFSSCVIHLRSVNTPKPCRSANSRCDKPDRLYRPTHLARCSGVEYRLRRTEEKESFMPHFTWSNHPSATCTLPDAYKRLFLHLVFLQRCQSFVVQRFCMSFVTSF